MNQKESAIQDLNCPPENHIKVLDNQGWVGLVSNMGDEKTIVNSARVSFGKKIFAMSDSDIKLLKYLINNNHTSPLEHVAFTFIVYCPIFVRSQIMRHRTFSYNEISRRYTDVNIKFYVPQNIREQSDDNRQASVDSFCKNEKEVASKIIEKANNNSLKEYEKLLSYGVCREQARGVLPQNLMTMFWMTSDLNNLLHFLDIRDHKGAQHETREYAKAIKKLITPYIPEVAKIKKW
jgi:thymidylate synthase (FAD)